MTEKRVKKLPDILTGEEQERLLQQPNPDTSTGLRNLCIMQVILDTGITLSELLNLQPEDINLREGKLQVRKAEREKNRSIQIGEKSEALLRKYFASAPHSKYVFCTLRGGQLNGRYIREMVKRYSVKAGVDKNIYPHSLRHTFAANLYRQTSDIRLVQKTLGHTDIATTTIYAYLAEKETSDTIKERPQAGQNIRSNLPKYIFKCSCGEIISRQMERCPGCGEDVETILEKIRSDFQRVNFGNKQ